MNAAKSHHHVWPLSGQSPEVWQGHQHPNLGHGQDSAIRRANVCKQIIHGGAHRVLRVRAKQKNYDWHETLKYSTDHYALQKAYSED